MKLKSMGKKISGPQVLKLEQFSKLDLPRIVKFQNKLCLASKNWTLVEAKAQLTDLARAKGKNVILAVKGETLCGLAGWVSDKKRGEFYGAPFITTSKEAANLLISYLVKTAHADRSVFIRIGAYSVEKGTLDALKYHHFLHSFDFIEVELPTHNFSQLTPDLVGFRYIPTKSVDPIKYKNLYNTSFEDVSNSPSIDDDHARETWASSLINPDLSGVWLNKKGDYVAFVIVHRGGFIDSIGISPFYQRKGLGKLVYQWMLSQATSHGIERVHATIASNNNASIKFHHTFGFREIEKKGIWQLDLK